LERRREDLNLRFPFGKTSLAVRRTRPGYATSPTFLLERSLAANLETT
jgi:hypothetical protein